MDEDFQLAIKDNQTLCSQVAGLRTSGEHFATHGAAFKKQIKSMKQHLEALSKELSTEREKVYEYYAQKVWAEAELKMFRSLPEPGDENYEQSLQSVTVKYDKLKKHLEHHKSNAKKLRDKLNATEDMFKKERRSKNELTIKLEHLSSEKSDHLEEMGGLFGHEVGTAGFERECSFGHVRSQVDDLIADNSDYRNDLGRLKEELHQTRQFLPPQTKWLGHWPKPNPDIDHPLGSIAEKKEEAEPLKHQIDSLSLKLKDMESQQLSMEEQHVTKIDGLETQIKALRTENEHLKGQQKKDLVAYRDVTAERAAALEQAHSAQQRLDSEVTEKKQAMEENGRLLEALYKAQGQLREPNLNKTLPIAVK